VALHPNVYLDKHVTRTLYTNTVAAWLWRKRTGIIAGRAAAALHGIEWIGDSVPVEMIARHGRRRPGVTIRDERIADDEIRSFGELLITSPARTALDLARHLPREDAIAHLDALAGLTEITADDVWALYERYRGARGITAARNVIGLMDGGARSPRESTLRLRLIDAGLPTPKAAISLRDDLWEATIAMGWEAPKVGVDCEYHRRARNTLQDIACHDMFQRLGWYHIRVPEAESTAVTALRIRSALRLRRWP
jgi:hypothetical protein